MHFLEWTHVCDIFPREVTPQSCCWQEVRRSAGDVLASHALGPRRLRNFTSVAIPSLHLDSSPFYSFCLSSLKMCHCSHLSTGLLSCSFLLSKPLVKPLSPVFTIRKHHSFLTCLYNPQTPFLPQPYGPHSPHTHPWTTHCPWSSGIFNHT